MSVDLTAFDGCKTGSQAGISCAGSMSDQNEPSVVVLEGRRGFNSWRSHIEDKGVLVFQAADVPIKEMRAYSIAEFPFPVIVVNRKDVPQARTFSLLHELTHLLLKSAGLCDLSTRVERPPEDQRVEVFCNAVAAACLMPANAVKQHPIVAHQEDGEAWTDPEIITLARYFSVSREAILRRLLTFGLTSSQFYEQKREQYRREFKATPKPKGFPSPARDRLSLLGRPFVRLILDSLDGGIVTTSDASDYLGIRLKHFPNMAASLETD